MVGKSESPIHGAVTAFSTMLGMPSTLLTTSCSKPDDFVNTSTLFLPAAFQLRGTWTYRRVVLAGGSALIAAIAGVWLFERALNVTILSAFV